MKILQVVGYATVGGAEKNTCLLTAALARRGHACHLVSPPGEFADRFAALREMGVAYHVLDFRRQPLRSLLRLRALARKERFALIHSHLYLADVMVFLATLGMRGSVRISTMHSSILAQSLLTGQSRRQQRLVSMVMLRGFHRVFTVSESLRKESLEYFRLPPRKIVTTLNSIDFRGMEVDDAARTALAARFGLERPTFKIGAVGHFFPYKSQITLVRAMAYLRDLQDIEVFLIGEGDCREQLMREAERQGVADRIRFTGLQEDMNEWYSLLNLFVHTSRAEALSRSILEAMYFGLPIAASDIPSTREVLTPGVTGLLFPPEDDRALAEAIRTLHGNPSLAAGLGEKARQFVLRHCSIESMIDAIFAHSLPAAPPRAVP